MEKLLDESETPGLSFDGFDCVGNSATNRVKFLDDRLTCHNGRFLESYKEFELDLVLRVRIGARRQVYDLLFNPVPSGVFRDCHLDEAGGAFDFCGWPLKVGAEWGQHGMIVGISQRLQCVQEMVSSIVRVEGAKERVHLGRNIRASTLNLSFNLSGAAGKGEVGVPNLRAARGMGNSVDSMIETGPQITDDIPDEFRDGRIVKVFNELHFVKELIRVAWVYFNDLSVGVYFNESLDFPFKLGEMFAAPSNFALRAVEWSRHSPDCINLKPLFGWGSEQLRKTPRVQPTPQRPTVCRSRQQPSPESSGAFCESE